MSAARWSGLREAHAHILAHGRSESMLWLSACTSREEALAMIRVRAAGIEPGAWLVAAGTRPEAWRESGTQEPGRHGAWPTSDELDAASPDRPCVVMSFDHHSGAANSAAMRAAGLRLDPPHDTDVSGPIDEPGVIVRDGRGVFTGVLLEAAFMRVRERIPAATHQQRLDHLRTALRDFARLGFDEVHDLWSRADLGPAISQLARAGELDSGDLTRRVWLYPLLGPAGAKDTDSLESIHLSRGDFESDRVQIAGGKVFADGTLNATTAWMHEPYRDGLDQHPCGTPLVSAESLRRDMNRCWSIGVGLAVHAIGDAAVGAVLAAAEAEIANSAWHAVRSAGLPPVRIEHAEVVAESDTPRIVRLWREMGMVISVQPCHLLYDIEALERRLPHRLHRVLPMREWIQAGLSPGDGLWFGSDAPIVRPDPTDSIEAATQRRRGHACVAGPESRAIAPEQAIDEPVARSCFTRVACR